MNIEVKYNGLKEIEGNLRFLREQFGVKTGGILIRGLRAGAKIIRDEARRRVPDHIPSGWVPMIDFTSNQKGSRRRRFKSWSGLLRSSIIEHAIPTSSRIAGGQPTVLIRVRNAGYDRRSGRIVFKRPGSSPGWYWWLEFGTARSPARPFLRPAFESRKRDAVDAFAAHVRGEIEDQFRSHMRRAA